MGLNPQIMQAILENSNYDEALDKICDEAILALTTDIKSGFDLGYPFDQYGEQAPLDLVRERQDEVVLICVCRSGKHRSVSAAEMLNYALNGTEWPDSVVRHTERGYNWKRKSRQASAPCAQCDADSAEQDRAELCGIFLARFNARLINFDDLLFHCGIESIETRGNPSVDPRVVRQPPETALTSLSPQSGANSRLTSDSSFVKVDGVETEEIPE